MCMWNFTKSPERYLGLPVYEGEGRWVNSSKVGHLRVPKATTIDMDNLFDGRSLFILDFISSADDGEFDKPLFMIVLVKTGVHSTPDGWMCEYDPGTKVIMLEDGADRKNRPKAKKRPAPVAYMDNIDAFSDFEDGDFDEHPEFEWGESSEPESQSGGGILTTLGTCASTSTAWAMIGKKRRAKWGSRSTPTDTLCTRVFEETKLQ